MTGAARGLRVVGVDSSTAMLEADRQAHIGSPLALPFADASFDVAMLVTALEFAGRVPLGEKPALALPAALRVLVREKDPILHLPAGIEHLHPAGEVLAVEDGDEAVRVSSSGAGVSTAEHLAARGEKENAQQ